MSLSDKMIASLNAHARYGEMTPETKMRLLDNIKDVKEAIKKIKDKFNWEEGEVVSSKWVNFVIAEEVGKGLSE